MKREQLGAMERLARAFLACADQEHGAFLKVDCLPEGVGAFPVSPEGLSHFRAMQAFHWCYEAIRDEIGALKREGE
jgi:hypothetical protein